MKSKFTRKRAFSGGVQPSRVRYDADLTVGWSGMSGSMVGRVDDKSSGIGSCHTGQVGSLVLGEVILTDYSDEESGMSGRKFFGIL